MADKIAHTSKPIHDLIAKRWSPRAFHSEKALSKDQILSLLEAARWAPSCFGEEPWRYIVCDKSTNREAWEKALSCLSESNQVWAKNAQLLLVAASAPNFAHNGKPNRWKEYDTGAASENICLQAFSMGLIAHQMGGFSQAIAREAFGIPEQASCMAFIAIGYQAEPDILEGDLRERELAPRSRRDISENFYNGHWGNGYGE